MMMTRWMSSRNAAEITLLGRKAYSSALSLTGLCDLTQRFNGLRQNKKNSATSDLETHHGSRAGDDQLLESSLLAPFFDTWDKSDRTSASICRANIFRGSPASALSQMSEPKIQTLTAISAIIVPTNMISNRGGNDFLSGIGAGSSTLTVGISFASCTFANSNSLVKTSSTASWIRVRRYKSAYVTPSRGNFRIEG